MKRIGLGLLAATLMSVGLGQVASAADIGVRGPAPAPAPLPYAAPVIVSNWTGCYVGGNIGGGWGRKSFDDTVVGVGSHTPSGFIGGGQVGCDFQVSSFVIGFQGLFDGSLMNGTHTNTDVFRTNINWFGSANGRVGFAVMPNALVYGKGGWAWVNERFTIDGDALTVTRSGWTAGGGIEWMFAPNWSVFAEYSYFNLGRRTYDAGQFITFGDVRISQTMQTAIVGVNFRFGAAPVTARY